MFRHGFPFSVLIFFVTGKILDDGVFESARKDVLEALRRPEALHFPTRNLSVQGESCFHNHNHNLTEELSNNSNLNLIAYDLLTRAGYTKEQVIPMLQPYRPAHCNRIAPKCAQNSKYRTFDGTCNNLGNPFWGSANTEIRRILPAEYSDKYNSPKGGVDFSSSLPNPRIVSATIHQDFNQSNPNVTHLLPIFGQFLDHDIIGIAGAQMRCCDNGNVNHQDWWPIRIPESDQFYSKFRRTCMEFTRSAAYCFPTNSGAREQMNILTHFLDASNIYGSDDETAKDLRFHDGGKLLTHPGNPNMLPLNQDKKNGEFFAGDRRVNETPGLLVMHILWFREHNRIADEISQLKPCWNDERIYQETRRLVIAEWQNIIYGEYLPVLLGSEAMDEYGLTLGSSWSNYDNAEEPAVFHAFTDAAYRFGHSFISGMIQLYKGLDNMQECRLRDYFNTASADLVVQDDNQGVNYILDGLLRQNAEAHDPFGTEDLTNFLFKKPTEEFGSDLFARNLQRGRDHGLPGWMRYRELCGLEVSQSWASKVADVERERWDRLATLYLNVEDVDLFTGGLVEEQVPGALTGRTFNCLKVMQFKRLKHGDRFFFTHKGQSGSFSETQIQHLRNRTFGDIICENSHVEKTQANVFLTEDSENNVWISCNSTERTKLDFTLFL